MVRLHDTKGLRHLARLLASPGREFTAGGLEGADARGPAGPRVGAGELEDRADLGDAGVLLDATAKARYRVRLEDLRAQVDEAEAWGDPVRAATAKEEIEFLTGELARAVGLGGRDRRAASHAERARLNATRAIRLTVRKLSRAHASPGRHLEATIQTGRYCSYTPDPHARVAWQVDVALPPPYQTSRDHLSRRTTAPRHEGTWGGRGPMGAARLEEPVLGKILARLGMTTCDQAVSRSRSTISAGWGGPRTA